MLSLDSNLAEDWPQVPQMVQALQASINAALPSQFISQSCSIERDELVIDVGIESSEYSKKHRYVLPKNVWLLGAGKASGAMIRELEPLLGNRIKGGVVTTRKPEAELRNIQIFQAGHPVPDKQGLVATKMILDLKSSMRPDDLIIFCLSGGASALLVQPVDAITFEEQQKTFELLVKSGASIEEINIIRRHISRVKGGQLAKHFSPIRMITLVLSDVLSDVLSNNFSAIGSGPTYTDNSTFQDCWDVMSKHHLKSQLPEAVLTYLRKNIGKLKYETAEQQPENSRLHLLADNDLARMELKQQLTSLFPEHQLIDLVEQLGYFINNVNLEATRIFRAFRSASPNTILIWGGEVTIKPEGTAPKGGRNQHLAAELFSQLYSEPSEWFGGTLATDGSDYRSDVAGGIISSYQTKRISRQQIRERLNRFQSYQALEPMGGLIRSDGDTGTNVCDVGFLVKNV